MPRDSLHCCRCQIARKAMRLLEAGRCHAGRRIDDIIRIIRRHARRQSVIACEFAHTESDRVVGAGAVATDAECADHLAIAVERHPRRRR